MPAVGRLRYFEAVPRPSAPTATASERQRSRGVLLLIHAFPMNARMWQPQLALADRGWRVVAPRLRGFGDGASDPAASTLDDYAGDIVDLLDALHITEAVIAGLSMGGYIALTLF